MKNSNTVEGLLPPELGAFTPENPSLRLSLLGSLSGRLLLMALEEEDKWIRFLPLAPSMASDACRREGAREAKETC